MSEQYTLPKPQFDAFNPEAATQSALGSQRTGQRLEQADYKSANYASGSAGWRFQPDAAELNVDVAFSGVTQTLKSFTAGENMTAGDGVLLGDFNTADLELSSSNYFNAADSASLSVTGNLTLELWVNLESSPASGEDRYFISKHDTSSNAFAYSFDYKNAAGTYQLRLQIGSGASQVAVVVNQTLTEGTWYHVAVVYTAAGGTADFYVNGAQVGAQQSGLGTSIGDNVKDVTIGVSAPFAAAQFFDGKMKDVRIWASARTATQLAANFDLELVGTETNLNANWKLNNVLTDSTANANTLTNNNSTAFVINTASGMMNNGTATLYKTNASFFSTSNGFIGFVKTTTTSGGSCPIVLAGEATSLTSISPGAQYYLSNTRGGISATAGTRSRKVAIGVTSTSATVTNIW